MYLKIKTDQENRKLVKCLSSTSYKVDTDRILIPIKVLSSTHFPFNHSNSTFVCEFLAIHFKLISKYNTDSQICLTLGPNR